MEIAAFPQRNLSPAGVDGEVIIFLRLVTPEPAVFIAKTIKTATG